MSGPRARDLIVGSLVISLTLVGIISPATERRLAGSMNEFVSHTVREETVKPLAERVMSASKSHG